MVFLPLPADLDDSNEDEAVLEATRQLSQYVAGVRHARAVPQAQTLSGGSPELREVLQLRVTSLAEELMKHDVELQELRQRSRMVPPEVHQLQEENSIVASRGAKLCEEAAQQSAKRGQLEEQQQQKMEEVQGLRAQRSEVAEQLEAAEGREAAAKRCQESALKALDLERRRSQDWVRSLALALQQRQLSSEEAEQRAQQAEREVSSLEARCAPAEVQQAESVAEKESLRRQQLVQRLEQELEEAQLQRGEEAEEQQLRQRQNQAAAQQQRTLQRLAQARLEARRLEDAAQNLAKELAESEQKAEESDRKAIAVAKELTETSKHVAQLRAELDGRSLRKELDAARKETGALRQRMAVRAHERSPLEEERAMKEALRCAWENEASERRGTEEKLHRADVFWQRLQEQLQSLTSLAHRCRHDLVGSGLPALPPLTWDSAGTAGSLKALVDFFESMAKLRMHTEANGPRVPSLSASPARSQPWR